MRTIKSSAVLAAHFPTLWQPESPTLPPDNSYFTVTIKLLAMIDGRAAGDGVSDQRAAVIERSPATE